MVQLPYFVHIRGHSILTAKHKKLLAALFLQSLLNKSSPNLEYKDRSFPPFSLVLSHIDRRCFIRGQHPLVRILRFSTRLRVVFSCQPYENFLGIPDNGRHRGLEVEKQSNPGYGSDENRSYIHKAAKRKSRFILGEALKKGIEGRQLQKD